MWEKEERDQRVRWRVEEEAGLINTHHLWDRHWILRGFILRVDYHYGKMNDDTSWIQILLHIHVTMSCCFWWILHIQCLPLISTFSRFDRSVSDSSEKFRLHTESRRAISTNTRHVIQCPTITSTYVHWLNTHPAIKRQTRVARIRKLLSLSFIRGQWDKPNVWKK